jgi:hypothetical protein
MSVKVAVRVRPYNERELKMGNPTCCVKMNETQTILIDPHTEQDRPFTFDYSFWSHDAYKVDDDGITRKEDEDSNYADQDIVYE